MTKITPKPQQNLWHTEPSQAGHAKLLASPFSCFQGRGKAGTEAMIAPKTSAHLYRHKDPGKSSSFYFWAQFGVHLPTMNNRALSQGCPHVFKQKWSLQRHKLATINCDFSFTCVYILNCRAEPKSQGKGKYIWVFLVRALCCFSAVLAYLHNLFQLCFCPVKHKICYSTTFPFQGVNLYHSAFVRLPQWCEFCFN